MRKMTVLLLVLAGLSIQGCTTLAKSHVMGVGSDVYATVSTEDVGVGFDWAPRGGMDSRLRLKFLTLGSSFKMGDGLPATPLGMAIDVLNGPLLVASD